MTNHTPHHLDHPAPRSARAHRVGFTLIEAMLAVVITAFLLGSVTVSISQLANVRETSKLRLDAHLRAELAINSLRRDIASVIRNDDLFWTRLHIRQGTAHSPIGDLARDEILLFNTRLTAIDDLNFSGEGMQYETQYRIEESHHGTMLWQRRDAVPDEFPLAGGIATPMVDGVIALMLEAYDGWEWWTHWDSDEQGLPHALRITVAASGSRTGEELYDGPIVRLRTVVPLDRVVPPADIMRPTDEELEDMLAMVDDVADHASARAGGSRAGGAGARGGTGARGGSVRGGIRGDANERPGQGGTGGGGGTLRPGNFPPSAGSPGQHPQIWTRGKAGQQSHIKRGNN